MYVEISDKDYTCGIFDSSHSFPEVSVTEPRRLSCYEIEIYTENGGVSYIDGKPHRIKAGDVLCAPPDSVRHTELPLRTYYVKISSNTKSLSKLLDKMTGWFVVSDSEYGRRLILSMLEAKAGERALLCHAKLFELLSWLVQENKRSVGKNDLEGQKSKEAIDRAIEYIEKNFRGPCTLGDIAEYAHISPIYFHGIFQRSVGKTPHEYVMALKIEESKRLLLTEICPVGEISEKSGFSSQSYFNRVFKQAVGVTPKEYRENMIKRYLDLHGKFE